MTQEQGSVHAFLVLKSQDGNLVATGELINVAHRGLVRSRMVFRFRDGSLDDEFTTFRQRSAFQLVSDRHIQRGPSYPTASDVLIETRSGQVTSRTLKDGKREDHTDHMDLPPDLANGMLAAVIQNLPHTSGDFQVSYIAGNPKPRVVKLDIHPVGKDAYEVAGVRHEALVYNIHVKIPGVAGVVAPLLGDQPTDTQIWVTDGEVHAFLKMQGALYAKGPIWTMEDTSAHWERAR